MHVVVAADGRCERWRSSSGSTGAGQMDLSASDTVSAGLPYVVPALLSADRCVAGGVSVRGTSVVVGT